MGVKTLQTNVHHDHLLRIENDLCLHLQACDLPCTLTSDLLMKGRSLRSASEIPWENLSDSRGELRTFPWDCGQCLVDAALQQIPDSEQPLQAG